MQKQKQEPISWGLVENELGGAWLERDKPNL